MDTELKIKEGPSGNFISRQTGNKWRERADAMNTESVSQGDRESLLERRWFQRLLSTREADREQLIRKICDKRPELYMRLLKLLEAHTSEQMRTAVFASMVDNKPVTNIGGYRVVGKIGEGGMGEVYLCSQEEPVHRLVAVKVLHDPIGITDVRKRFDVEREALARIASPYVAQIYDAGVTGDRRPYFVMEYVVGTEITRHFEQTGEGLRAKLALFMNVCSAVQHAHEKGIIHRDIKPSNILVATAGGKAVPKIIDFGIAKIARGEFDFSSQQTRAGSLIGTPEYMSPEQADIGKLDLDTRTDVYSLGVLLYKLICGEVPFSFSRNHSLSEVRSILLEEAPAKPSQRLLDAARKTADDSRQDSGRRAVMRDLKKLLPELDCIALKAMQKDRCHRYDSPSALAADIQRLLDGLPVDAAKGLKWYFPRKVFARYRAVFIVAAVMFVGKAGIAFYTAQLASQLADERDAASQTVKYMQRVIGMEAEPGWGAHPADLTDILSNSAKVLVQDKGMRVETRLRLAGDIGVSLLIGQQTESAYELLETVLAEARTAGYAESAEILIPQIAFTVALIGYGSVDEAEVLLNIAERKLAGTEIQNREAAALADWARGILWLMRAQSDAQMALQSFQSAITKAEGIWEAGSSRLLHLRSMEAIAYRRTGNDAQARKIADQIVAVGRNTLGPAHPLVVDAVTHLAVISYMNGDEDEARRLMSEVNSVISSSFNASAKFPFIYRMMYLGLSDEIPVAEAELRRILAEYEKGASDDVTLIMESAYAKYALGLLLAKRAESPDIAEAGLLLDDAIGTYRHYLGPKHDWVLGMTYSAAVFHARLGDKARVPEFLEAIGDDAEYLSRVRKLEEFRPFLGRSVGEPQRP